MEILNYQFTSKEFNPKTNKVESKNKKMRFTLWHNGHKLFQNMYGMSVTSALAQHEGKDEKDIQKGIIEDNKLLMCLIAATYVNDEGKNDEFTAEEMLDSNDMYVLMNDPIFIQKMFILVADSMPQQKGAKDTKKSHQKKKKK